MSRLPLLQQTIVLLDAVTGLRYSEIAGQKLMRLGDLIQM